MNKKKNLLIIIMFFCFIFINLIIFSPKNSAFSIDLSTFTENDANGRFTYNTTMVNSTALQYSDYDHYVYHEYGEDFFQGAYNFTFESNVTLYDDAPLCGGIFMLSNTLHDYHDMIATPEFLAVYWWRKSTNPYNYWIYLETDDNISGVDMGYRIFKNYSFTLNKTSPIAGNSTITLKIYNDTNHQDLNTTLSIVALDFDFKYMYCAYSYGDATLNRKIWVTSKNYTTDYPLSLNVLTKISTNVEENTATLNGYLDESNDSTATIRFQYGTNYSFGTNTSNQSISGFTSFYNNITGLNPGQVYYYRAYANTSFGLKAWGDTKSFLTKPEAPTNTNITFPNASFIVLNWTKGSGANNTVIVKKDTNLPIDILDGTIIYNGSGLSTTQPVDLGTPIYYRAWSFCNWSDPDLYHFSDNGTNFTIGGLYVNCFDETTNSNLTFNLTITNLTGSETYVAHNCVNTHNINATLCPQGDDVSILVSSSNHSQRIYYLDIFPNILYLLNAYLPETEEVPLGNDSKLYLLTVINEADQTMSDVHVIIKGLINETSYETVTDGYSDGNGQIRIWLFPGKLYKILLSKTSYQNASIDYIPEPPDIYGQTTGGIFKMYYEEIIPPPVYIYGEHITFNGYINRGTNILYVNYTDDLILTMNADLYVYVFNTSTNSTSLFSSISYGNDSSFQAIFNDIDNNSIYTVILFHNHSVFGFQRLTLLFPATESWAAKKPILITPSRLNFLMTANYGTNPLGWSNSLCWMLLLFCYFEFTKDDVGLVLIVSGCILLFVNYVIGFYTLSTFAAANIPILHIVGGIMIMWAKNQG